MLRGRGPSPPDAPGPTAKPNTPTPRSPPTRLAKACDANMELVGRPVDATPVFGGGSSDMGNVSQVIPSVQA
jgi:hypothetical protein